MYNPSIWLNLYIAQFIFKTFHFLNINIISLKLKIFYNMIYHIIISKFINLFIFILLDTGNTFYWRLRRSLFYYMIRFFVFIMSLCTMLLTLRLLISYIYGAPSKARNANVVYIWTYDWQRWNNLFLFAAQCFNTESMQRGFLRHICV